MKTRWKAKGTSGSSLRPNPAIINLSSPERHPFGRSTSRGHRGSRKVTVIGEIRSPATLTGQDLGAPKVSGSGSQNILLTEEALAGTKWDTRYRYDALPPRLGYDHGASAFRILFGVIWLVDATLKWLPGFRNGYMETLMGQAQDQPSWLQPWFDFWIQLQHPQPAFFADFVAALETVIAVSLILGVARKIVYGGAIALSLLIWGTAEGFGGPYTAGSADVGTAVVYALVFSLLLTISYQGPCRLSVDYWLEQRISWWHWVAEVGHHHEHRRRRRVAS